MKITRTWLLLGAGAVLVAHSEAFAQNRAQGSGIRISKETSATTEVTTTPGATTRMLTTTTGGEVTINSTPFSLTSYANMTEANMLAHLLSGDSLEIELSSLAQLKATSQSVRDYAAMLTTDHRDHLARSLRMTPDEHINPMPLAIDPEAARLQETLNSLRTMSPGWAWDAAFVRFNAAHHQNELDLLNMNAKNAHDDDFEALVGATQVALTKHRDMARTLATNLAITLP
jgi:putative membrane protein